MLLHAISPEQRAELLSGRSSRETGVADLADVDAQRERTPALMAKLQSIRLPSLSLSTLREKFHPPTFQFDRQFGPLGGGGFGLRPII